MKWQTPRYWRSRGLVAWLLFPASLLFGGLAYIRRWCYRHGYRASWRSPVPVLVVGNITAGGAGKTPLVIALVSTLVERGFNVGIAMRSYGGTEASATLVSANDDVTTVGDEPLMLARRTGVSVAVAAKRTDAVKLLVTQQQCQLIVCDDGMQHYALQRDLEIAVVDSDYLHGNGFLLPAGPLREPASRLNDVDLIVYSGVNRKAPGYELAIDSVINLAGSQPPLALSDLQGSQIHAVAAIAHPDKFFNALRSQGIRPIEHPFPDHYQYSPEDLEFGDDLPILMTEKDMVKCESWASGNVWYVRVSAVLDEEVTAQFKQLIKNVMQ